MLTDAKEIVETCANVPFELYLANKNLRLATERRIKIIGGAARNGSPGLQAAHPEIPWRKIITQRHVLAHEYGGVKEELIYAPLQLISPSSLRSSADLCRRWISDS